MMIFEPMDSAAWAAKYGPVIKSLSFTREAADILERHCHHTSRHRLHGAGRLLSYLLVEYDKQVRQGQAPPAQAPEDVRQTTSTQGIED